MKIIKHSSRLNTVNTGEFKSKSKLDNRDNGFNEPKKNDKNYSNVISFQKYLKTSKYKIFRSSGNTVNHNIPENFVTTIMFTDIVKSTQLLFEMGDLQWIKLLQSHHTLIRNNLEKYSGKELQIVGDAFFMCFHSTENAIDCARNIQKDMKKVNLPIRIGIHTGKVLLLDDSTISGLTIHIASRVTAIACANQIVVSQTVKDVMTGSKHDFKNLGFYTLKGMPDAWNLFSLVEAQQ